ncbi:hypothetical protein BC567DRAFT_216208 [Phyllosticta citribraziliensis]
MGHVITSIAREQEKSGDRTALGASFTRIKATCPASSGPLLHSSCRPKKQKFKLRRDSCPPNAPCGAGVAGPFRPDVEDPRSRKDARTYVAPAPCWALARTILMYTTRPWGRHRIRGELRVVQNKRCCGSSRRGLTVGREVGVLELEEYGMLDGDEADSGSLRWGVPCK